MLKLKMRERQSMNREQSKQVNQRNQKKGTSYHTCGICGERYKASEMTRNPGSCTGWLCIDCDMQVHPEYEGS